MSRLIIAFLLAVTSGMAYAREPDTKEQAADSLAVEIIGDTVNVWDFGAYENCNCVFVTTVTRVGDTLDIMQMDVEPVVARCNCFQDMRTSITGLPAGAYTAVVYRDLRVKFPEAAVIFVGAVQFEYHPAGSGAFTSWGYQSGCLTDVGQLAMPEEPRQYLLMPAFPNPFNPGTTIGYALPERSHVTLTVFNTLGEQVATLVRGEQEAGYHEAVFDGRNLASGVYIYRLTAGSTALARKMTILR